MRKRSFWSDRPAFFYSIICYGALIIAIFAYMQLNVFNNFSQDAEYIKGRILSKKVLQGKFKTLGSSQTEEAIGAYTPGYLPTYIFEIEFSSDVKSSIREFVEVTPLYWAKANSLQAVKIAYHPQRAENTVMVHDPFARMISWVVIIMAGFTTLWGLMMMYSRHVYIKAKNAVFITQGDINEVLLVKDKNGKPVKQKILYSYKDILKNQHVATTEIPVKKRLWTKTDTGYLAYSKTNPNVSVFLGSPPETSKINDINEMIKEIHYREQKDSNEANW